MTPSTLITRCADLMGLSEADILGRSRDPRLVRCRWAVALALRWRGESLPAIGRVLNKHHTTVLNGIWRGEVTPRVLALAAVIHLESGAA